MSGLYNLKENLKKFYSEQSIWVDRILRFLLAYAVLTAVGKAFPGKPELSSVPVTAVMALVCAFLPLGFTGLVSAVLVLIQIFALSPVMAAVMGGVFLLMFIFYLRFAPGKILVILLTPLAFMVQIPCLIPVIFGLLEGPVVLVPMTLGAMIYNMLGYISQAAPLFKGNPAADEKIRQVTLFFTKTFDNKAFWIVVAAIALSYLAVYIVRQLQIMRDGEIAVITGALVYLIVMAAGDIRVNMQVSYGHLSVTVVVAIATGLLLRFIIFSQDYSRMEKVQFEDDEYYYYVKAIPKIQMAPTKKTVKTINEHSGNTIIESPEDRESDRRKREETQAASMKTKIREKGIEPLTLNETREMLLTKELEEDLKKELKKQPDKERKKQRGEQR